MKKIWTETDLTKHDDWGAVERDGEVYQASGSVVQDFIKSTNEKKIGVLYYDDSTNKYLAFADEENRDLYLEDSETYADFVLGIFDAPSPYTANITMTSSVNNVVSKDSTGNYIEFTPDILNRQGASTGEAIVITYSFIHSTGTQKVTQMGTAGVSTSMLVDNYLKVGANRIIISITGRQSLISTIATVYYSVIELTLTSTFEFGRPQLNTLTIPYVATSSSTIGKTLTWYIDGEVFGEADSFTDVTHSATKYMNIHSIEDGVHTLLAQVSIQLESGSTFLSNVVFYTFLKQVNSDESAILFGLSWLGNILSEGTPHVSITRYSSFDYQLAAYSGLNTDSDVNVYDNGDLLQTITLSYDTVYNMTYTPMTIGEHTISFSMSEVNTSFVANVEAGDTDIEETTEDLQLRLLAKGRTNSESNPDTWSFGNITTTFNNFKWNVQNGWDGEALVIPEGSSIEIDYKPFVTNSFTFEIDFQCTNVTSDTISIMSLANGNQGLTIAGNSATLSTNANTSVNTRYGNGDRIHLTFIKNATSTSSDNRMLYIVNNGILERANRYDAGDTLFVNQNITIAPIGCTVKIYSIRAYSRAITVDQAFCNFAIDQPDLLLIANRNDIYEDGVISSDKISTYLPIMIITGDISHIMQISSKERKNEWNDQPVTIEYYNSADPTKNFTIENADIRLQGTSSLEYPRKNFRIYSVSQSGKYRTVFKDASGNPVANGKYAFKDGSAPVTCWCLKADYAESSGSHNTGVARLWNDVMYGTLFTNSADVETYGQFPLRTNALKWAIENDYPYDVRTTIDGFPIVLFHRTSISDGLECFGQYNFNNDKSTEDVYGFTALKVKDDDGNVTATFDNSKVQCFEVLDSDNEIAEFTDVSQFDAKWDTAFEARYSATGKNDVTALKRLAVWINSCLNDESKWIDEKFDHFDVPKLAAYYVYLMRFGGVDQTVKNAMLTTEDGDHWYFINYDNDTIFGINNSSRLFDTWKYDRSTQIGTGYYYAGHVSVLWNCFEADPECMEMVKKIDSRIAAYGLNYTSMCRMFDEGQSSQWCERIYNANGRYKYIDIKDQNGNPIDGYHYMLQGSRLSHRHWWLLNRLEYYDNLYGTGSYTSRVITIRANQVMIPQNSTFKYTPAIDSNFGYGLASTVVQAPTACTANVEYTSTPTPQDTGVGNFFYLYNANNFYKLDVSGMLNFAVINLTGGVDVAGGSRLKILKLGDPNITNDYCDTVTGLVSISGLEELDITNCTALSLGSDDLAPLVNLHVFKAENSNTTNFSPAEGVTLNEVVLPNSVTTLSLVNATVNDDNGSIQFADFTDFEHNPSALRNVVIKNVDGTWDAKAFVLDWLDYIYTNGLQNEASLILEGINWTGLTNDDLLKLTDLITDGSANYKGKIVINEAMNGLIGMMLVETFGPSVFLPTGSFVVDSTVSSFLDIYPYDDPIHLYPSDSVTLVPVAFPIGSTVEWSTAVRLNYPTFNFDTNTGTFYADINSGVGAVDVSATINGTTKTRQVSIIFGYLPTSYSIVGNTRVATSGTYNYTCQIEESTSEYKAKLLSKTWVIEDPSNVCSGFNPTASMQSLRFTVLDEEATVRLTTILNYAGIGNRTTSINITVKKAIPVITATETPVLMGVCFNQGWCASLLYMTDIECEAVTDIGTVFAGTNIENFDAFRYFINVDGVANEAFKNCTQLESIILPPITMSEFGSSVFEGCTNLQSFDGEHTEVVGSVGLLNLFKNCTNLTTVKMYTDNDRMWIGIRYFLNCTSLETITLKTLDSGLLTNCFDNCTSLSTIVLEGDSWPTYGTTVPDLGDNIGANAVSKNIYLSSATYNLISNAGWFKYLVDTCGFTVNTTL